MRHVHGPQLIGYEEFRRLPDEFLPLVAEEFFHLRISDDDLTVRPNDKHAIRRRIEKATEGVVSEQLQEIL
jgi:hypothetical protein